jgi:hemerythrin-like domain-containing protein
MDAIQFLKKEHQKAKAAMEKVVQAPAEERGKLWKELEPELATHEELEDECLYTPLADDLAGAKDPKLVDWRQRHQDEVDEVEELIGEIDDLDPTDASWPSKVKSVQSILGKHIQQEEQEIFPRIAKVWPAPRLQRAGTEMEEMKAKKAGPES